MYIKQLLSQSLRRSKQLKWADEDGGELNNVQYFDKGAEPSQVRFLFLCIHIFMYIYFFEAGPSQVRIHKHMREGSRAPARSVRSGRFALT